MTKKSFTAIIQNAGGGGAFVEIPFDVEKEFGSKRPKVKAMIEGFPYRGTLVRTPALAPGASVGSEHHMLLILKESANRLVKHSEMKSKSSSSRMRNRASSKSQKTY